MAHVYVDSNAAGAGTGADWTNAYTTLSAALTAKAAGDNFWVAHNHAESTAGTVTLTAPGTITAPNTVMCVTSAGTVPPVSADLRTTATVTTTGANALTIASGYVHYYGITFSSGSGATNTTLVIGGSSAHHFLFKLCKFIKAGTTGLAAAINFNASSSPASQYVVLDNCTVKFGSTSDGITFSSLAFLWKNTASAIDTGGSIPAALLNAALSGAELNFEGVDLSAITGTLVSTCSRGRKFYFRNCKLGTGVTVMAGSATTAINSHVYVINADSGATNYFHSKTAYQGSQIPETTIVRTGGATDGTTPIAWKIVTTANSKWTAPFESIPLTIWNDTTAANVTVTVYGYIDQAAVPKNDDIWIEVSYMGSSATPIATIDTSNTKADYLATNADQGTDSSTWGGGDTTTRFAMAVTLSSPQPAMKGPIYVTVKVAKASSTFYIDPKIVLT